VTSSDAWHRSRAPVASTDFLRHAVEHHWGFVPALTPLYGERDLNTRVLTPDGERWLLKLSHPDTTRSRLDFEQNVLDGLSRQPRAPVTPKPLPAKDGTTVVTVRLDSGVESHLRMLSWVPGEPLDPSRASVSSLEAFGAACAHLNEALAALEPCGHEAALPRDLPWDLQNTPRLADLLADCPPFVPRDAVLRTLDRFDARVAEPLARLPRQIVHNDLNPDNLRFDRQQPSATPGIIDFGDMVIAPVICDLAIACAYVVGREPDHCLERVIPVLRGFNRERPLDAVAWRLLPTLLEARLCQSLVIQGARIGDAHPDAETLARSLGGHARRLQALQSLRANAGDRSFRLQASAGGC
jgi:Ser/Thr protein kinase RdoA (MazF antagonist)